MLKSLSRQTSRKQIHPMPPSAYSDLLALRGSAQTTDKDFAHNKAGVVRPASSGAPKAVFHSAAGYNALNPQSDVYILKVESSHMFAAVLTNAASARGGYYLRQHLYSEIQAQLSKTKNASQSFLEAFTQLNKGFKGLHPFNPDILQGVRIAAAYVDFESKLLHFASTGSCRCVVGRRAPDGKLEVAVELCRSEPSGEVTQLGAEDIVCIPLTEDVETITLGSTGFWRELAASKAVMRLGHYFASVPGANQGSAAAHLTNLALHEVTRRMQHHPDPRMSSLRSVSDLMSLQTGEKSQYKFAGRQPVRRRRGDVHGDFTAVVFYFDWQGRLKGLEASLAPAQQRVGLPQQPAGAARPYSHWDLLRLHFLDFPKQSREETRQTWIQTVKAASAQSGSKPVMRAVDLVADSSKALQPPPPLRAE